jgi:hypothetical protein
VLGNKLMSNDEIRDRPPHGLMSPPAGRGAVEDDAGGGEAMVVPVLPR